MLMTAWIAIVLFAGIPLQGAPAARADNEAIVRAFVDAYNAHDIDAMAAVSDEGIQWVKVESGRASIETDGKPALRAILQRYFAQCPTCRSTLEWTKASGSRVAARERASWTNATGAQSQTSLSVYELRDGRILRVLYFPAEKD
jgi:hypothetical protein